MSKKKKKPYYPNNIEAYLEAPSEWFDTIPFDEFMDWKCAGWELPSSVSCIVREHNLKTGKVKEYVYSKAGAAKNRVQAIMNAGESSITVCNKETIHHLIPEEVEIYDDPLA